MNQNRLILGSLVGLLLFSVGVSAYQMNIDVLQDSVSGKKCGTTAEIDVKVRNEGDSYGALCWWWTSLDSRVRKGTPSCLEPDGGQYLFTADVDLPSSPGTNTLSIACRNYGRYYLLVTYNDCENGLTWGDSFTDGYPETNCYRINGQSDADCLYKEEITIDCYYCGDGQKNPDESCSTCPEDYGRCTGQSCSSNNQCETGYCVHNFCRASSTYCGDGYCDPGETCKSESCCNGIRVNFDSDNNNCGNCGNRCGTDSECYRGDCIDLTTAQNCGAIGRKCKSNEECVNKQCRSRCANGRKDPGENCANCPQDVKCASNQACNAHGQCIQLGTVENCGSIGDNCGDGYCLNKKCVECRTSTDCTSAKGQSRTGKYECSQDRKGRNEILIEKGGQCINGKCSGSSEIKSASLESCGEEVCYEGKCGCPEGYGKCDATWNCVKKNTVAAGKSCDCDVECQSGYCKDNGCLNVVDVKLSSVKKELKPGEETPVTLSISSNLNDDIDFSATLSIGSGAEISSVISGDDCTGNQCKIAGTLSGKNRRDVTVSIRSRSETSVPLTSSVSYTLEGKSREITKQASIQPYKEPPLVTGAVVSTESKAQKKSAFLSTILSKMPIMQRDTYLWIGSMIVGVALIIFALLFFVRSRGEQETDSNDLEEKANPVSADESSGKNTNITNNEESSNQLKKSHTNLTNELETLFALVEKGILTKREFKKKKKELLKGKKLS